MDKDIVLPMFFAACLQKRFSDSLLMKNKNEHLQNNVLNYVTIEIKLYFYGCYNG